MKRSSMWWYPLLGLLLPVFGWTGSNSLEQRLQQLGDRLDLAGASLPLPDLRETLGDLEGLRESVRGEWQRLRLLHLFARVWGLLESRGRDLGKWELVLESLGAQLELEPEDLSLEVRYCRALASAGRHQDAILRLEKVWYQGKLPAQEREQVGAALFQVRLDLAAGKLGPSLDLARGLGRELRRQTKGTTRARVEERLAEIALLQRQFGEALELYDSFSQVVELDASQKRQHLLLKGFVAAAMRGGVTEAAPSSFFTIQVGERIPFQDAEIYREFFEQARVEIGRTLESFPEGNLLVRVLVDEDYVQLLSPHSLGVREDRGILLRRAPFLGRAELRKTVFHEYTHHVLASIAHPGVLPRWFHEGVALYLEQTPVPLESYRQALRSLLSRHLPSLTELRSFSPGSRDRARILYDCSLLFIDFLVERFGRGILRSLSREVGEGASLPEAFLNCTRTELSRLYQDWRDSLLEQVRHRLKQERALRSGKIETQETEPEPEPELEIWVEEEL